MTNSQQARIGQLALQHRLPAVYFVRGFTVAGGLLSYGPDIEDLARRAALYLDRIFKGASLAELPVEQPTKFDFVINLKAAQTLGLSVPDSVLQQATEIIQ